MGSEHNLYIRSDGGKLQPVFQFFRRLLVPALSFTCRRPEREAAHSESPVRQRRQRRHELMNLG